MDNVDLEREILLKHARSPLRMGALADAHATGECRNPLCGDKISVSFIVENEMIKNIKILPSGCSISLASASLMTELVEGKNIAELSDLIENVNESFSPKNAQTLWPESLSLLSPLKRIRENPLKIPCVLISWIAVKDALKRYQGSTTH